MTPKGLGIASAVVMTAGIVLFSMLGVYVKNKTATIQAAFQNFQSIAPNKRASAADQIPSLRQDLVNLQRSLVILRFGLLPLEPLRSLFTQASILDPSPSEVRLIAQTTINLIKSSQPVLDGAEKFLGASKTGSYKIFSDANSGQELINTLLQVKMQSEDAKAYFPVLDTNLEELRGIDGGPRFESYVEELGIAFQVLKKVVDIGIEAPALAENFLGVKSPKNYLVLAQNSYEIRATGGFISGAWLITIDRGKIVRLLFYNSPDVDDLTREHPPPPMPIYKYMLASFWLFRDSNWSPDFPTTSKVASSFFELGQGIKVHGVVGIDDHFARELVLSLAPIKLEAFQQIISSNNITSILEQGLADIGRAEDKDIPPRKFLLKVLFEELLQEIQSGITPNQFERIVKVIARGLEEKHLLVHFLESNDENSLARLNWDGAMRVGQADYLHVVDSNIGYNKINHNIDQAIHYALSWNSDGSAKAELEISYSNTSTTRVDLCQQGTTPGGYEEWKQGCYWDYLRIYTPRKVSVQKTSYVPLPQGSLVSTLAKLDDPNYPSIQPGEKGTTSIGLFFTVRPEEKRTLRFTYHHHSRLLSPIPEGMKYSLLVQKQAGTVSHPLTVEITAPAGMTIIKATPSPTNLTASKVRFQTDLVKDRLFTIFFRTKPAA